MNKDNQDLGELRKKLHPLAGVSVSYYFFRFKDDEPWYIGLIKKDQPNDLWLAFRSHPVYVDDEVRQKLVPLETPPEVPNVGPAETDLDRLSLEATLLDFLAKSLQSAVTMHRLIPKCWHSDIFGEMIDDFRGRQNRLVEVCNEFLAKAARLKRVLLIRQSQES